jgi:hypothetical protein
MRTTKKIALHFFIWVAWFASQSISSLIDIENFPIWPATYNYLSLIIISYLCYYLTISLCNSFSVYKAAKMNGIKMAWYILGRAQTALIILIVIAYPIGSWFFDGWMVNMGYLPFRFPDFLKYTEGRWGREGMYVFCAVTVAVLRFIYLRKDNIIRSQRAQNKLLLDHVTRNDIFLKELDEEVKRYMQGYTDEDE